MLLRSRWDCSPPLARRLSCSAVSRRGSGSTVLSVFFEVAHYAYVPSLVGRESVVEGNSKLQISYSAAEAGGPGVAGVLVQFISAPGAVVIDAVSFLVSAVLLRRIEAPEPPVDTQSSQGVRHDVEVG